MFLKDIFSDRDLVPCNQRIHLIAHSMGNRLLQSMLYSLKTENITRVIDQVVLLSADVSFRAFEAEEDSFIKLPKLANRVTVYVNRKDAVLAISQFSKNILSGRLGKIGPSEVSKMQQAISVVDCTSAKNDLKTGFKFQAGNHWNYLSSSSVQNDVIAVLNDTDQTLIAKRQKIAERAFLLV